jgi:hypothetical protein
MKLQFIVTLVINGNVSSINMSEKFKYDGHVCRHSSHYKYCENLGRWVPFHVFRKMRSVDHMYQITSSETKYLLSHKNIHISDDNIICMFPFDKCPQDILNQIFDYLKHEPVTFLLSKGITQKYLNNCRPTIVKNPFLEKTFTTNSYTYKYYDESILPIFNCHLAPNNYEEIEKRLLWLFEKKHVYWFLNASKFYKKLLTREFADYIFDKYSSQVTKLDDGQYAIFVLLPYTKAPEQIYKFFPCDSNHMVTLRDTFKKNYKLQ